MQLWVTLQYWAGILYRINSQTSFCGRSNNRENSTGVGEEAQYIKKTEIVVLLLLLWRCQISDTSFEAEFWFTQKVTDVVTLAN